MKRKLIIGSILAVIAIASTTAIIALFATNSKGLEFYSDTINSQNNVELYFNGYHVKFIVWKNDNIKVKQSDFYRFYYEAKTDISFDDNILDAKSESNNDTSFYKWADTSTYKPQLWLSLMQFDRYFEYSKEIWDQQFVDFYIYIPEDLKVKVYSDGLIGANHDVEYIPTS